MTTDAEDKKVSHDFYREALQLITQNDIPFLLGGAFAMREYTGIYRDTKDLDVFCRPRDYIRILKCFEEQGFRTEVTDVRWLAKVFKGDFFVDVIFNTVNNICTVDDSWFERAPTKEVFGVPVKILSPVELVWCKIYVQNRERFDGADVNHILLKLGHDFDYKGLLARMEPHWQLLLSQIINFQFVYPAERDYIPRWLFDDLMARAQEVYDVPAPVEKVCRGPIIDQTQYHTDIKEWDYKALTIKTV
jgi:hypothetical protein